MELFNFASRSLANIRIAVRAQMWAVNETSVANMKARITKSKRMKVGSLGLLYCSETHSFTTPFIVLSEPDENEVVENVWPGRWRLPFRIQTFGTLDRRVSSDLAKRKWTILKSVGAGGVSAAMRITGTTVFVPINIPIDDWASMVSDLGTLPDVRFQTGLQEPGFGEGVCPRVADDHTIEHTNVGSESVPLETRVASSSAWLGLATADE